MTAEAFRAAYARLVDRAARRAFRGLGGDERRLTARLALVRITLLVVALLLLPVAPDIDGNRDRLAVIWLAAWLPSTVLTLALARFGSSRLGRGAVVVLDVTSVSVLMFAYPELTLPAMLGLMLLVGLHAFHGDIVGGLSVTAAATASLALARSIGAAPVRAVDLIAFVLLALATTSFVGQGMHHQRRSVRGLESSYARARDQLAIALESSSTGLWVWHSDTDQLECSGELLKMFGVDRADTRDLTNRVHPEDRPYVRKQIDRLRAEGGTADAQFRIVLDDRTRWVILRARTLDEPEGEQRLVGTVTDITAQREQQLQWERSRRMQTVSGLAGGVAHDFNNLLAVITMSAEILRRSPLDEMQSKRVEFILGATHRGAALSSRLLSFARSESGNPRPVQLDELLHGIEPMLRQALRDDITLTLSVPHRLPSVIADSTLLEQALLNVTINARDAIPGVGSVVISARHEIPPSSQESHGTVVIEIEDDGIGMSEDVRERALEPFFTTKEFGRGTGLGLASVFATISALHGDVEIDSALGSGTRVRLRIPAARERRHTARPRKPAVLAEPGATILVVDDDEGIRKALRDLLSAMGHHVLVAADGHEALALFPLADHARVNLVVTDVVMPELSGPDLVKNLQRMGISVPIVYMTGYVDQHSHQLPTTARVLRKPFSTDELLDCLNVALARTA